MALTGDRNTARIEGVLVALPMAAAALVYAGALVVRNGSYAEPGSEAPGLFAIGRAEGRADNSDGANGDISVLVRRGCFRFANSAGADAIALADVGRACFVVDDQTVAKTSDGGARSVAGRIADVDAQGVFVEFGAAPGGLVALTLPDAAALDGAVPVRLVSPISGRLAAIHSVIDGALTTGNATLTAAIDGAAVTGGVVTITQAGSAAGDVDQATPTAANEIVAGDVITITPGGTNDAARTAAISLLIET